MNVINAQTHPAWEELSELEQLATYYSDVHKDAYGSRPRGGVEAGHPSTVEEYKKELDRLGEIVSRQIKEEKAYVAETYEMWKKCISRIMEICSCSKADAIRHDIDAHEENFGTYGFGGARYMDAPLSYIVEGYIYSSGIGFDKKAEIMEILESSSAALEDSTRRQKEAM